MSRQMAFSIRTLSSLKNGVKSYPNLSSSVHKRHLRFQASKDPEALAYATDLNKNLLGQFHKNVAELGDGITGRLLPTSYFIDTSDIEKGKNLGPHIKFLTAKEAETYVDSGPESSTASSSLRSSESVASKSGPYPNLLNPYLRAILYRSAGFDIENILTKQVKKRFFTSKVRLMTTDQVKKRHRKVVREARAHYVAPPDLYRNLEKPIVLDVDEKIKGHDLCDHIFVDISERPVSKEEALLKKEAIHRDRFITVRQPDGAFRTANREERQRTLRVFYSDTREEYRANRKVYPVPPVLLIDNAAFWLSLENGWFMHVLLQGAAQFDLDSPEWIDLKDAVFKYLVENYCIDQLYSTKFYPNLIHWVAETDSNSLTEEEYIKAVCLVLLGRNFRNSTLANFEEVKTLLSCLILFNKRRFLKNFEPVLGQELAKELTEEIVNCFNKSVSENSSTEREFQLFEKFSVLGALSDAAQFYGVREDKFKNLKLLSKNDEIFLKVIEQLRKFMKTDRNALPLKADSEHSQNIRLGIDQFGLIPEGMDLAEALEKVDMENYKVNVSIAEKLSGNIKISL